MFFLLILYMHYMVNFVYKIIWSANLFIIIFEGFKTKTILINACSLTFKEWVDNFCVICYDFSASLNESPAQLLPLVKAGNLRVTLQFNAPATKPVSILCFLEIQSAIEIQKNGKITVDTI